MYFSASISNPLTSQQMNPRYSFSIAIAVFLLINTSYFWEKWIGFWVMPLTLLLMALFVALLINLFILFIRLIRIRFSDPNKNKEFFILCSIQAFTLLFPFGLIDFRKFEGKDIISAQREGVANCMLYLRLKEDGKFVEKQTCFGVDEKQGHYLIRGDSIFLYWETVPAGVDKPAVGIIIKDELSEPLSKTILYFRNLTDTIPLRLDVTKYDLPKN